MTEETTPAPQRSDPIAASPIPFRFGGDSPTAARTVVRGAAQPPPRPQGLAQKPHPGRPDVGPAQGRERHLLPGQAAHRYPSIRGRAVRAGRVREGTPRGKLFRRDDGCGGAHVNGGVARAAALPGGRRGCRNGVATSGGPCRSRHEPGRRGRGYLPQVRAAEDRDLARHRRLSRAVCRARHAACRARADPALSTEASWSAGRLSSITIATLPNSGGRPRAGNPEPLTTSASNGSFASGGSSGAAIGFAGGRSRLHCPLIGRPRVIPPDSCCARCGTGRRRGQGPWGEPEGPPGPGRRDAPYRCSPAPA